MPDRKIVQLQRVPIFAGCTRDELRTLAMNADQLDIPAARKLITEGEPNDTFYVLVSGEVEIEMTGQAPIRRGAGEIIGEISMLDRGPATATVTTVTTIEALVMSHAQFRDSVQGQAAIALKVIGVMAHRLRHDYRDPV